MSFDALFSPSICYGAPGAEWTLALPITLPLTTLLLLYAIGAIRLWHRSANSRRLRLRHAVLFAVGWLVLALALESPLHALGERVFTAHMIEHELLMAVAAPLFIASYPAAALMWALPLKLRKALGAIGQSRSLGIVWGRISRPGAATMLHGVAIWIWHIPALFEAALERGVLHYLQHASFFGTGVLFWWALLPRRRSEARGGAVLHLFLTTLHTGLLGVLLVVSPRLWYPANTGGSQFWNLTSLEDQQLAGLVMWVPAGLIYGGAALFLVGLWIRSSGEKSREMAHALNPV